MRLMLGFVLLAICVGIGHVLSLKFTYRKKFFNDFNCFNDKLKNELMYTLNSIKRIIMQLNFDGDFFSLIKSYFETNNSVNQLTYLSNEEKEFFTDYVNNIGKGDIESQKVYVDNVKIKLNKYCENAISDESRYKKLYIKLGFLIGLIALIIML